MKIGPLFLVLHFISFFGFSQINSDIVKPKYKIIRAEEMGEDFSVFSTEKLFEILDQSEDKIELRKAAQALGDRNIITPIVMNQHFNNILFNKVRWSNKSGHKNNVNLCSNERSKNTPQASSLRC